MPSTMIFFRDSQLITAFLLLQTTICRNLIVRSTRQRPYLWIQSTVAAALKNRFGQLLLEPTEPKIEDVTDLVNSVGKLSSNEVICINFCKLVDRFIFLGLTLLYGYMVISLFPKKYLPSNYDMIESLS